MAIPLHLLCGGLYHDFDGFRAALPELLPGAALDVLPGGDALLDLPASAARLLCLYTCLPPEAATAPEASLGPITAQQTAALVDWIQAGGRLLALHATTVIPDDNPRLRALIGGHFLEHPQPLEFTVYPVHPGHAALGAQGSFALHDELYLQAARPDVQIHAVALHAGAAHPVLWTRSEGAGHVLHLSLGHGPEAWANPGFRALLRSCVAWLNARA